VSLFLKSQARLPSWVFVPYASDVTDARWDLLEAVLQPLGKRGRKFKPGLRRVVDGMLYVAHTGCQWCYLPESFGPWTRVWSQFRRWSRNGTWARLLAALHKTARRAARRAEVPSMVVLDTHLARGSSNGGATLHDRGGGKEPTATLYHQDPAQGWGHWVGTGTRPAVKERQASGRQPRTGPWQGPVKGSRCEPE
jgi:transposase